jgi:hypothetical protein
MDWECLGAKKSSPIDCYVAQTGSGTYSTWQGALLFNNPNAGCLSHEVGGGTAASHSNLFENQMSYISHQSDAADAIYFFSYGKFTTTCPKGQCEGATGDTTTFGQINGIAATQTTIQDAVTGATGAFPITRFLYNDYNNSSATAVAPSSQATLNFTSEYGFLCKASTNTDIDPQTGVSYRSEIESIIRANGFFPLDSSPSNTITEGTVANPAVITDPGYTANDPTTPTKGYCLLKIG